MYLNLNNKVYEIKVAKSFFSRLKGLMFQKNIDYGMYFPHTNSIHTFFMKENIDVIGLNEKNVIIYKAVNVSKNQVVVINNSIKKTNILELPSNVSHLLSIGDTLSFISK